jgi:hypothetical protein
MERLEERRLVRVVLWRRLDVAGLERCALWRERDGWSLAGTLVLGQPLVDVRYEVRCDAQWRTQTASMRVRAGACERKLELATDLQGNWWSGGREVESVRGCLDVDLQLTPATNTLPLRRMNLPVGADAEVVAAWVRFPNLDMAPLPQRYARVGASEYRYESPGFAADITVDDLGLVIRYGDLWERTKVEDV